MRMENLVVHFNQLVEEFFCYRGRGFEQDVDGVESSSELLSVRWIPPPEQWCKINIDAVFNLGKVAIGVVVHDFRGKLIYLASKEIKCGYVHAAKLLAVEWASRVAKEKG